MREINFDGLIGPSHNYAGLALGNIASALNAGGVSSPRQAALQGVAKMRRMLELGLIQGILLPHDRPNAAWLRELGFDGTDEEVCAAAWSENPVLLANAFSASPMWTANAATVSPGPDTADGRCHFSAANLATMLHRNHEAAATARQLRIAFADTRFFAVHDPLPGGLGDEGAANVMRLGVRHGAPSLEIFVYGVTQHAGFPARQHFAAGRAIARRHRLHANGQLHVQQSSEAIAAGAFHNDVVAVANENVLLTHEKSFEDRTFVHEMIRARCPDVVIVEAPQCRVSLADAIHSYLFNSQLVTLPRGGMMLVVPAECRETPSVWQWLNEVTASGGPITGVEVVDVRESMRNGGGPACLRLRVAVSEDARAAIDPRFLVDQARCDLLETVITSRWPDRIAPADLGDPGLWHACRKARTALLDALGFADGEV